MNPLVSIITPNYNASKFVSKTIESVISQTYKNWELIIVDDCSTDNSVAIIEGFIKKNSKIKLLKLNVNSGPAIARNRGIEEAKGNYIAFLDSDDRWLSNKLNIQVDFMLKNNNSFTFSSYYSVNELSKATKLIRAKNRITYNNLLTNNYIGCLTVMYSVEHIGKMYFPLIKKRQDWALWLKITKNNIIAYGIKEPLGIYTKRETSVSSDKFKLLKYNWKVYRKFENLNRLHSIYYFIQLVLKKILK